MWCASFFHLKDKSFGKLLSQFSWWQETRAETQKTHSSLFFTVHVSNCFTLEPQKECIVNYFIDNNSTIFDVKCLLFSPSFSKGKEKDLIAATALVQPNKSLIQYVS